MTPHAFPSHSLALTTKTSPLGERTDLAHGQDRAVARDEGYPDTLRMGRTERSHETKDIPTLTSHGINAQPSETVRLLWSATLWTPSGTTMAPCLRLQTHSEVVRPHRSSYSTKDDWSLTEARRLPTMYAPPSLPRRLPSPRNARGPHGASGNVGSHGRGIKGSAFR